MDFYIHKLRAEEEILLSKNEMKNCMQWYVKADKRLQGEMKQPVTRGEVDRTAQQLRRLRRSFDRARRMFLRYLAAKDLPKAPSSVYASSNQDPVMEEDLDTNSDDEDVDVDD